MSTEAGNFPAFVREYKDAMDICQTLIETQLPGVGDVLAAYFGRRNENMMISTTAESSKKGKLLRLLLQDKTEVEYHGTEPEARPGHIRPAPRRQPAGLTKRMVPCSPAAGRPKGNDMRANPEHIIPMCMAARISLGFSLSSRPYFQRP